MSDSPRSNLPPLSLHVPEPVFRPGDESDFNRFEIPPVGAAARPDSAVAAGDIRDLAYGLIRVLDADGAASGGWNPRLDADTRAGCCARWR